MSSMAPTGGYASCDSHLRPVPGRISDSTNPVGLRPTANVYHPFRMVCEPYLRLSVAAVPKPSSLRTWSCCRSASVQAYASEGSDRYADVWETLLGIAASAGWQVNGTSHGARGLSCSKPPICSGRLTERTVGSRLRFQI